jgi:5-formyltetrahydrofolate cyclo-ligase
VVANLQFEGKSAQIHSMYEQRLPFHKGWLRCNISPNEMTKSELRKTYKQKRLELTAKELEFRSERICEHVFSHFQLEGKICSLFLPIERQREINTYLILEKGTTIGAQLALPRCEENHKLKHFLFEHHRQLKTNSLGIPEPQSGKLVPIKNIDVVFVPLLAIDNAGHRVGYGKGYYDRFLNKCRPDCLFIGLHLFDEFAEIEDLDATDMPVHFCITPEKLYRFAR